MNSRTKTPIPSNNTGNAPLTIALPAALSHKLEAEAKKRGVEKSMLLMEAALGAVIDSPKIANQENAVQASFRIPPVPRQKLSKLARARNFDQPIDLRSSLAPW